jgi:tyrosine-protein phosphatase YwqE
MTVGWVDLHNHLLPGVDDGAPDVPAALAALRDFRAQGVRHVVTTPHWFASWSAQPDAARRQADFDRAWEDLRCAAADTVPDVVLERGAEVALDTPHVDLTDTRLRLAGGPAVLVEFAALTIPPQAEDVLYRLRAAGYRPVLAHPERYRNLPRDVLAVARAWRRVGTALMLNAASPLGGHGQRARDIALVLLAEGLVDLVGSDYHGRPARPLAVAPLVRWLRVHRGDALVELLLAVNPRRLLDGEDPLPVPPWKPRRPWWRRLWDRTAAV